MHSYFSLIFEFFNWKTPILQSVIKDKQIVFWVLQVERQILPVDRQVLWIDGRMHRRVVQVDKGVLRV